MVNEADTVLAVGSLGIGVLGTDGKPGENGCTFPFTFEKVADAMSYSVKIGIRGGPDWTQAQMESNHWTIALTLGKL